MPTRLFTTAPLTACLLVGCTALRPPTSVPTNPPSIPVTPTRTALAPPAGPAPPTAPAPVECDLHCEFPQMLPRAAPEPDYTGREVDSANGVLGAMTDDLLACYKKRVRVYPQAHGFITVDILIGPEGHVRSVDTTGGAILGSGTMACIVHRIEGATFEPPHGGGTLRVRVPFSLRRVAPGEET